MTECRVSTCELGIAERGELTIDERGFISACDAPAAAGLLASPEDVTGQPAARAFSAHGRYAVSWLDRTLAGYGSARPNPDPIRLVGAGHQGQSVSAVFDSRRDLASPGITHVSVDVAPLGEPDELEHLRAEVRELRALATPLQEATLLIDRDLVVSRVLTPVVPSRGWEPWRLVGRHVVEVVLAEDRPTAMDALTRALSGTDDVSVRVRITPASGGEHLIDAHLTNAVDDPDVGGLICRIVYAPEGLRRRREDHGLGGSDALTGLQTREALERLLLKGSRRLPDDIGALIVDVVGLDDLNQNLGYDAGDAVIQAMSRRLTSLVEPRYMARLSGGRFIIAGPYGASPSAIKSLARKALRAAIPPVGYLSHRIAVRVTVGAATGADDGFAGLVQRAGISLTMFRLRSGGDPEVFGSEMVNETVTRARLILGLREIVHDDELHVVYQPIVNLVTGATEGMEALLRWTHPVLGPVPPDTFIPLAETIGAVNALGRWVLRRACRDAASWGSSAQAPTVSVNVSPTQLESPRFTDEVVAALRAAGLAPERLTLEVTETAVLNESETSSANLHALAALGVHISLDDFGTGYSSLSVLHRLPIHELKIDKSFVAGVGTDPHSTAIVATVLELAVAFGATVVAEGIETTAQLDHLAMLGCSRGQGFLLGRPASLS